MDKMVYANEKDKKMFFNVLDNNLRILLGKIDPVFRESVIKKILSKFKYLNIYDWKKQDKYLSNEVHGYTQFSTTGETGIRMYGNENYYGNSIYIERVFSHELWHALMTFLNNVYGGCSKRSIDLDKQDYKVQNYSGFLLCSSDNQKFTVGYFMAECLSQMLALATVNINNDEDYKLDDIFNYSIKEESTSPADDLLTFAQVFIAAFSLDSKFSYSENYKNGNGIIDYQILSDTNRYMLANIFITGSIKNPIMVMDEYDKFMGAGSYILLQKTIDEIYNHYRVNGKIKVRDFISVCNDLNSFVHERLYYYLNNNRISKDEYDKLINNFTELLSEFKSELNIYKVTSRKVKYQKIVDKLLKKQAM